MNEVSKFEPQIESISRFQSLQAGQYWRARKAIPEEGIDQGMVLLLQSIRWVEGAAHTIVLRAHPSKIGSQETVEYLDEDGNTRTHWIHYDEHLFLLDDFLARFEHEPDAQRVRAEETQAVHGKIATLQAELIEAQSDPELLARVVEDALATAQALPAPNAGNALVASGDPQNNQQLASAATGTIAAAIGSGITAETVSALKQAASREHQIATIKAEWIQGKTEAIGATIKALTPFYEEQAAAALAQTEDVRTYVAKLMEGIESLDLYVGKNVDVETVREGEPAAKGEPLTLVQKKLLMDEELAVWADIDEWFDFSKEALFFEALRKHDDLVRQIFPTERCVLVMAVSRRFINYGDVLANHMRNAENKKVFLLVRNGMNIHRVFSPVESHLGSARLFPSRDDQEQIFRGLDGSQIKFDDVAYSDRHAEHEQFALHYKRFLLLACGLDHRLKLFDDFYIGPPTLDFVSQTFKDKYCRFLHDDDASRTLQGESRLPLQAWIAEKNAYLRSGSRVLCNWPEVMNPTTAPSACKANSRDSYDQRYSPKKRMDVVIAYRDGQSLCVDVEVSGHTVQYEDRTFNCKVNLTRFKDGEWDYTDQPFLCLDAVEPAEIHWYIHNRATRQNHLAYIRFFKHALKTLQAERDNESVARQHLARALEDGGIASGDEATAIVQEAVIAWRAANRGRALPSFDGHGASASWQSLLDQMYMLAGEGKRQADDVAQFVAALGYTPLRLILSGAGKLVVYASPLPHEMDNRLEPHPWVHRITLGRQKKAYVEKSRSWAILPKAAASETTIHQWAEADCWAEKASVFNSHANKQTVLAAAAGAAQRLQSFNGAMSKDTFEHELNQWQRLRTRLDRVSNKYVLNPQLVIPFGIVYYPRSKQMVLLCVGTRNPHAILYRLAPDEQARKEILESYLHRVADRAKAKRRLEGQVREAYPWEIIEADISLPSNRHENYVHEDAGAKLLPAHGRSDVRPTLQQWFDSWKTDAAKADARYWFAEDAISTDGELIFDQMLGIQMPEDYDPVFVRETVLHGQSSNEVLAHLMDICPEDMEIKTLVAGQPHSGYSSSGCTLLSPAKARAYIQERAAKTPGAIALPDSDFPDVCPAPPGVERWRITSNSALIE